MGEILEYRSPRARDEETAKIGMIFFLASWAMMFGSLFFSYGALRIRAVFWPPLNAPELPLLLPGLNSLVVIASSGTFQLGLRAVRLGQNRRLVTLLATTFLLGLGFIGLQLVVWSDLRARGLTHDFGSYAAVFYGLTWIHAAHVLVGLLAVAFLLVQAARNAYGPARFLALRLWAMYWHFVGVIWVVIYLLVYVL